MTGVIKFENFSCSCSFSNGDLQLLVDANIYSTLLLFYCRKTWDTGCIALKGVVEC